MNGEVRGGEEAASFGDDWWSEAAEEDTASFPDEFFSGDSFWNNGFIPPPPRPPFLDEEQISSDGLTTCDLCSWALEGYSETSANSIMFGSWTITLIVVSLLSALLGAIFMIIFVHFRSRLQTTNGSNRSPFYLCCRRGNEDVPPEPPSNHDNDKAIDEFPMGTGKKPWLVLNRCKRRATPLQLTSTNASTPAATANHYTVDSHYTCINEAVYSELDRAPTPAYQNSAFSVEGRNFSPASSAYYSDISNHDRYEIVENPWLCPQQQQQQAQPEQPHRLKKPAPLHSNYI